MAYEQAAFKSLLCLTGVLIRKKLLGFAGAKCEHHRRWGWDEGKEEMANDSAAAEELKSHKSSDIINNSSATQKKKKKLAADQSSHN